MIENLKEQHNQKQQKLGGAAATLKAEQDRYEVLAENLSKQVGQEIEVLKAAEGMIITRGSQAYDAQQ